MPITNGYCTLAELRERLIDAMRYTASTISFTASSKTIADTAYRLKRFQSGDMIQISGSASNDGYYTVATGNTAGSIVVEEALTDESAGESVTIQQLNDVAEDTVLESVVEGVSRFIDEHCGRRFYSAAETRYYTAEYSTALDVDDLVSVTTLQTDSDGDRTYEDTWATTDYDLLPFNAALASMPYTRVDTTPNGYYAFPTVAKGVKLVGSFGWPAVPAPIKEACLLMSARLARRKDAIFGVVGSADMGTMQVIPKLDPDVRLMLEPFRRMTVGGV